MPTSILIATGNPGKAREFREMLASEQIHWKSLSDFPSVTTVEETGLTFEDNARLKATGYSLQFNTWTIADDSGLEVDVLAGKPGVYSARWAEMNGAGRGDADNNVLLLRQLDQVENPRRKARFVCVLALSDPTGKVVLTTRDTIEGRVLRAPAGANGFGYDSIFYVDELGKTTAELAPQEKHRVSHRGKALRKLAALLPNVNFLRA